ncbi:hypothetical protein NEOLEDRAFT_1068147 [Neolentinus lepideus HHB14362 ss-1]|uniref:Peptide N-acetyl-beta-D-glucosaminyl asparaginase amidase A N-terminal domain-containing protein n=1 Tax=Neolentinus lepideus HHB14362 ss-1 TaxID=1314782 RepID=A0A165RPC3_9AGAM|nr:hypothetical protein NEOLEDRAFT_1068147 [Neolentinus lepideus HHB14362 ss-1]
MFSASRVFSGVLLLTSIGVLVQAAVQVDFQVVQPLTLPAGSKQCTVEILSHTFGNSYGHPEIVQYSPPTNCGAVGSWAGISLNFTVTSNGTQYDRLGTFTLQDVEIWRTSTPEPVSGDGIIWTYVKDVSRYTPLFAEPGNFILELDNVVETGLEGQYATTLHATFYTSSDQYPAATQSNVIIPLGNPANNTGAQESVPPIFSLNVTVPENAVQIYAELQASGNSDEEFWYYNAANEYLNDLPSGTTYGDGPFREVRLLVDGQLAGVAFPYPVLFTGAILPEAWMPITSYGALDLPTYFLDLTPFIPVLTDGSSHTISIDVSSAESNHSINGNWFVSGNLQVVTDPSGKPTTGNITVNNSPLYATTHTVGNINANGLGTITVNATHDLHIESTIVSGSGETTNVVWSQSLQYSNTQYYLSDANVSASPCNPISSASLNCSFVQNVVQTATGTITSTHNGATVLSDTFSYPFAINLTNEFPLKSLDDVVFDHSYERTVIPSPLITGSTIHNRQVAVCKGGGSASPYNNNTFSYTDLAGNTYQRQVNAVNRVVVSDHQSGSLAPTSIVQHAPVIQSTIGPLPARFPGDRRIVHQS